MNFFFLKKKNLLTGKNEGNEKYKPIARSTCRAFSRSSSQVGCLKTAESSSTRVKTCCEDQEIHGHYQMHYSRMIINLINKEDPL